jgi:tape measure domain-containing protein
MSIEVDIVANQSSIDSALRKISANLRSLEADSKRVSGNISNIAVKNVDTGNVSRELKALRADINKTNKELTSSVSNLSSSMSSLAKNIALTLTGGVLAAGFIKATSSFNELGNRIALVTGRTDDLILTQERLIQISTKTFTSVDTATETFNRFGMALRNANVETEVLLEVTDNVQKALAISGGSAESASAAIFQLGQGLSAGALRGQELNSVLEQAPRIATAVTDELGVTIGELRAIAEEGGLTTEVILSALRNQGEAINAEFNNINPTITKASIVFGNAVTNYVGQIDRGLGLSGSIAKRLLSFSESLNKISVDLDLRVASKLEELDISGKLSDVKLVAGGVLNVLSAIFSRIGQSLPKVIIPIFTSLDQIFIKTKQGFISLASSIAKTALGQRATFLDFIKLGDSVESAFFDVFSSKSPQELRDNLDQLAYAISIYGKRWFNIGNSITTLYRSSRIYVENTLKYFNLMEQKLILFRFDSFEDFSWLLKFLNTLTKEFISNFMTLDVFVKFAQTLVLVSTYLDILGNSFTNTFSDLSEVAKSYLSKAQKVIFAFISRIRMMFYELYIYLVGNSVWPDTMEEIVDWAKWLSSSVVNIFNKLVKLVLKSFGAIVTTSSKLIADSIYFLTRNIFNKELAASLVSNVAAVYDNLIAKIVSYKNKIKSKLGESLKVTKEKFTSVFSLDLKVNLSFAQAVEQLILFVERVEKAIATKIIEGVLSAWIYVSDKAPTLGMAMGAALVVGLAELFGVKLFAAIKALWTTAIIAEVLSKALADVGKDLIDKDLFFNLAEGLGKLMGTIVSSVISNLPLLYAALFDAAAGFRDGLLSSLGVIGSLVNRVINMLPGGGLIDLLLFGTGLSLLLGKFGMIKNLIGGILTLMTGTSIMGVASKGGLLGWLLLGNGRMLLAGILGAFALLQLIPGIFSDVGNKVATLFGSLGLISILLFGAGNTFRGVIYAIDFIGTYLLRLYGSTASLSLAGLLWPTGAASGLRARIAAFWAWFRFNTISQTSRVNLLQTLLGGAVPALRNFTQAYLAQMNYLRARSLALGGPFGIVGNVLFGRFGRTALIAALVISLFAGVANAAESSSDSMLSGMGWMEYGLIGLTIFGAMRPSKLKAAILAMYSWVTTTYRAFVFSLALQGAVASTMGAVVKGALMSVMASVLAFLGKLVAGIIAFLFSWVTASILAIGFIGLMLFGEGDGIMEKLANLGVAIKNFFTGTTAGGREARKGIEELLKPLNSSTGFAGIKTKGVFETLNKVDLSGLSSSQIDDMRRTLKRSVNRLEELKQAYEQEGSLTRAERREANRLLAEINSKIKEAPEIGTAEALNVSVLSLFKRAESLGVANLPETGGGILSRKKVDYEGAVDSVMNKGASLSMFLDIDKLTQLDPVVGQLVENLNSALSNEEILINPEVSRNALEALADSMERLSNVSLGSVIKSDAYKQQSARIDEQAKEANNALARELALANNRFSKETALLSIQEKLNQLGFEELTNEEARELSLSAVYNLQKKLSELQNRTMTVSGETVPLLGESSEGFFSSEVISAERSKAAKEWDIWKKLSLTSSTDLLSSVNEVLSQIGVGLTLSSFKASDLSSFLEGVSSVLTAEAAAAASGFDVVSRQNLDKVKREFKFQLIDRKAVLQGVIDTVDTELTIPDLFAANVATQVDIVNEGLRLLQLDEVMSSQDFGVMPQAMKDAIIAERESIIAVIVGLYKQAAIETKKINFFSRGADLASQANTLFSSIGGGNPSILPLTIFGPQAEQEAKDAIDEVERLMLEMSLSVATTQSANLVGLKGYIEQIGNAITDLEIDRTSLFDRLDYALSLVEDPISFNDLVQLPPNELKAIDDLVLKLRALQIQMWWVKAVGAITGQDVVADAAAIASRIETVTAALNAAVPDAPKTGGGKEQTWWEKLVSDLSAIDLGVDDKFLANLNKAQIDSLASAAEKYKSAQEAINKAAAGEVELRRKSLALMKEARLEAVAALNDGTYGGFVAQMEAMGSSLDSNFLGSLTATQTAYVSAIQQKIMLLEEERKSLAAGSPALVSTTAALDSMKMKLEELQSSATVMSDAFKDGLTNFLKGEATFKEFLEGLLDTFTSTIIEKFSTGFTDALFNSLGLDQLFNNMFQGALELGSSAGGAAAKGVGGLGIFDSLGTIGGGLPVYVMNQGIAGGVAGTSPGAGAVKEQTSMFQNMFSGISELFSGLLGFVTKLFSGIFSIIGGLFGFADGGYISGPGGPRSDSIMAMVSNGEYVVNAATTKRWLPFLEQINANDGRLPKFADGGAVGPANATVFKTVSDNSGRNKSEQVFNINVTGDVSLQARKEIARMIPEITAGVNMTNRERGSR